MVLQPELVVLNILIFDTLKLNYGVTFLQVSLHIQISSEHFKQSVQIMGLITA